MVSRWIATSLGNLAGKGFSLLGLLILLILALGCASIVPREIRRGADRSLSFRELRANPDLYLGRKVLLGGEILETRNLKDQTEIEILQKPLGRRDMPVDTDESEGRFIVFRPGYLDPAIYRSGRYVTVVGEVLGDKALRIGEAEYRAPVLFSRFLHLWPGARRYRSPDDYPYFSPFYPWFFGWGFYYAY